MKIDNTVQNDLQYQTLQPSQNTGSTDTVSKELQMKIMSARKQLNEIDSKRESTIESDKESKVQKRQEIKKQISELNRELHKRELEKQQEQQQKKREELKEDMLKTSDTATTVKEPLALSKTTSKTDTTLNEDKDKDKDKAEQSRNIHQTKSPRHTEAFISADGTFRQVDTLQGVVRDLKGQANVLEAEINLDKNRTDITEKEIRLEKLQEKAAEVSSIELKLIGKFQTAFHTKLHISDEDEHTTTQKNLDAINIKNNLFPQAIQRDEDGNAPDWLGFFRNRNSQQQLFANVQLELYT